MKAVKRRYLSAAERKREILDAALTEFSANGYVATSLERIAKRAGISKSGIYAHYASKHEIFEAMLLTGLVPEHSRLQAPETQKHSSLPALLDSYLDRRYAALVDGKTSAAFRLLIAESGRTPELVRRCASKLQEHMLASDREFLAACAAKGQVRPDLDLDQYLLTGAPAGLWMILITIYGEQDAPVAVEKVKALHKKLMLDLLLSNRTNPAAD